MAGSKSMMVAMTDLKIAMKVKWVKYSLIFMSALAPVFVIVLVGAMYLIEPSGGGEEMAVYLPLFTYMGAAMLALMAVIPAGLIAANALVGEKESRTLEPLLCTPLTDRELVWGKTLSSLIPCLVILFGGTAASTIGINILMIAFGKGLVMFPDVAGMFLIFVAGPVVVLAVVSVMILVSGRVSRVYEAYQTGSAASMILLVPMFAPFVTLESSTPDPSFMMLISVVTFLIAAVMATVTWILALKRFNRDTMVSLV